MKKLAIIGAGLSGLYAAHTLEKEYEITIFEARSRLGGRVHTLEGFDLGPSWVWGHHHRILSLIRSLNIELFPQYVHGHALYDAPQGVQPFLPPASPPSARMKGGVKTLIDALASSLHNSTIRLAEPVIALNGHNATMEIKTVKGRFEADLVLCTLPPRVAAETLCFDPPLPPSLLRQLSSIPTWMGHAAKCVIEFQTPFWRDIGLSGFCFSPLGPLGEMHDACTDERAALFGFVRSDASMETFESDLRAQIERIFGESATPILSIRLVDWRRERFSSTPADQKGLSSHPTYGLSAPVYDNRLIFIGTETAFSEGGYLEGAIRSVEEKFKRT